MKTELPFKVLETTKKAEDFLSKRTDQVVLTPIEDLKLLVSDLIKCIYSVADEPQAMERQSNHQNSVVRGKISIDENGTIVAADTGIATILGKTQQGLVKHRMQSFIDRSDKKLFNQLRMAVFERGTVQACRLNLVHSDGRSLEVQLNLKPQFNRSGECQAVDTSIHLNFDH